MPAGAVHDDQGVGAWDDGPTQLVEHQLHGRGRDVGEDQRDTGVALGADGTEQIGRLVAEVTPATGSMALLEPATTGPAGLANAGLVEEPDLDLFALGPRRRDLGDHRRELFLNACCAFRSACGCIGRVFCQDRPSSCSRRSIPFSL